MEPKSVEIRKSPANAEQKRIATHEKNKSSPKKELSKATWEKLSKARDQLKQKKGREALEILSGIEGKNPQPDNKQELSGKITNPLALDKLLERLNKNKKTIPTSEYNSKGDELSHDYDDHYYIENNDKRKLDQKIKSVTTTDQVVDGDTTALRDYFHQQIVYKDPALGSSLQTTSELKTREKMEQSSQSTPRRRFKGDEDDVLSSFENPSEIKKQLTDKVIKLISPTREGETPAAEIDELYESIADSSWGPILDKNHLAPLKAFADRIINSEGYDNSIKGKTLYLMHDFYSLIDGRESRDAKQSLKKEISDKINSGQQKDIAMLSEAIKLKSPNNSLTKEILQYILPEIQPPFGNIDNQIDFALVCLDEDKAILNLYEEHPHFKKSDIPGYKKINEINYYIKNIFETAQNETNLLPDQKDNLQKLLSANMNFYSNRLNDISDDSMNHDHIVPLFESVLIAKKLGLAFDTKTATDIFSTVYHQIFQNNTPRISDFILQITEYCDEFGLNELRQDILKRGIRHISDSRVSKIIKEKYKMS